MVVGTAAEKDVCVLFADGLRFDVAGMLKDRLDEKGLRVRLTHRLSPLPTVTATAKPFATVVHDLLQGGADVVDFNPQLKSGGQSVTAQKLRDEMAKRGMDILGDETRPPQTGTTGAWVETGRLDELGHKIQGQLAAHLDTEIETLIEQITGLLECGWLRVRVVTDHGWLLLPGGLPRVDLPAYLAATKWARCATVMGDSKPTMPIHCWHWNVNVRIASPPGIACFTAKNEYAHGGISPQECIVPELVVERGGASTVATVASIAWRGMRCRVSVATNDPSVRVSDAQVEQDLVISLAVVELFRVEEVSRHLAFRGGAALFRLHVKPSVRYQAHRPDVPCGYHAAASTRDRLGLRRSREHCRNGVDSTLVRQAVASYLIVVTPQ